MSKKSRILQNKCIDLNNTYYETMKLWFGMHTLRADLKSNSYEFSHWRDTGWDINLIEKESGKWNQLEGIKRCGKKREAGCLDFTDVNKKIVFSSDFGDNEAIMEINKDGIELKVVDGKTNELLQSEKRDWNDFNSIKKCSI